MRIIGGKYRGKKLNEFELSSTRPTLDRVKESIFNLIQFDVKDSVVLDLFSGTGALGIEAISRGAKKVYLIDNNANAIKLIKDNLDGIDGDYVVEKTDALEFLKNSKIKFDIVLLDPPFKTEWGIKTIEYIISNNLLNDDGIIIFETAYELSFDLNFLGYTTKEKKYGTVAVYKITKD